MTGWQIDRLKKAILGNALYTARRMAIDTALN